MTFTTISSAACRSLLGAVVALALAAAFLAAGSPAKAATGSPIGELGYAGVGKWTNSTGATQQIVAADGLFASDLIRLMAAGAAGSPTSAALGAATVGGGKDSNAPGEARAFRVVAPIDGTISDLHLYVDAGTTAASVHVGVYDDSGGEPASLLSEGVVTAPTAGAWADVQFDPVSLSSGQSYWVAVLGVGGTLAFRDSCCGATGMGPSSISAETSLTSLPSDWSSGASYWDAPLSAYATEVGTLPATLMGDPTVQAQVDEDAAGQAEAFQAIATATGTLDRLSLYLTPESAATEVVVAVYEDQSDNPGQLLTEATVTAPTSGWNTVTVPAISVSSGVPYWLALLSPADSGTVQFADRCCGGSGDGPSVASATTSLSDLPSTWSSGQRGQDAPAAFFAPLTFGLSVTKAGTGNITSSDGTIDCGVSCAARYTADTTVTLTAQPGDGAVFVGWGGGCTGSAGCSVSLAADQSVTATFDVPPATPTIDSEPANPTILTSADFAFSDSGPSAQLQCQLDGGGYSACTSPAHYAGPLATGSHTFQVKAIDAAGVSSDPTGFTWTINSTSPAPAPTLTAASVNGAVLTLSYDQALDPASVPAAADFTVIVDGSPDPVGGVAVLGARVTLTLNSAVAQAAVVTLSYVAGAQPLQNGDRVPAANLVDVPVPNETGGPSSQTLIQADLEAGRIDYGASLIYRAWALFWDPRLPARYDGGGSTGEDTSLFPEIKSALPSLPADQQAELQRWIARPTEPISPFGRCAAANAWFHLDDPNDNSDTGFRAWVCAASQADADKILDPLLISLAGVKQLFAQPEPAGMGPPVPDTLSTPDNGGNGKIDVYLLATNQCRDRNGRCLQINGNAVASTVPDGPIGEEPGFPARSSSGYMLISLDRRDDVTDLAHEFFHILQFAHTVAGLQGEFGNRAASWYTEASASWAEWNPQLRDISRDELNGLFDDFQQNNSSLLEHSPDDHQYQSWIWPLFQELEAGGATSVYQTWASAESASDVAGIDRAVNSQLPFADNFREFSVWNLQREYVLGRDTGLESVRWQSTIPDKSFSQAPHVATSHTVDLGTQSVAANVEVLAAGDDRFKITDPRVRQVTIDLSQLANAGSADLDIVGRLGPPPTSGAETSKWRRIKADSSIYTFCRDNPDEDFSLFYAVVSNHASNRIATGPDPAAAVTGSYTVTAQDHCDIPIGYEGTFKVKTTSSPGPALIDFNATGNVKFKYNFTSAACASGPSPPTPDALRYCYVLDSAQETWTAPTITTDDCIYTPRDAQFAYKDDADRHGELSITRRSPDPNFADTYFTWFGSSTKTMDIDVTCQDDGDQDDGESMITIKLPFYSIISEGCYNETPPPKLAGWQLSGSCTFQNGRDVVTTTTWSWDLSPIFPP